MGWTMRQLLEALLLPIAAALTATVLAIPMVAASSIWGVNAGLAAAALTLAAAAVVPLWLERREG